MSERGGHAAADHPGAAAGGLALAPYPGGVVAYEPRRGQLLLLNPTAARMLAALSRGEVARAVARDIAAAHGIDPAVARGDLAALLRAARRAGVVPWPAQHPPPLPAALPRPRGRPALDAVYRVGERAVRVTCHPAGVAAAFAALAAPARAAPGTEAEDHLLLSRDGNGFVLARDRRPVERPPTAPAARWALVRRLVALGRRRRWLALLHGAAVSTPAGCLLICGDSGAGKSTLLVGLAAAGLPLVADDILPVEAGTRLVWPVPLAVSLKRGSWRLARGLFPEVDRAAVVRFGGRTMRHFWPEGAAAPIGEGQRVAAVIFPQRAGAAPVRPVPLDPLLSLTRLGEGGSELPATDAGLAEFLGWWQRVPAFELGRGQLGRAVREVRALVDRLRA